MGIRQWNLPEQDPAFIAALAGETGQPELVCRALAARGIREADGILAFLEETTPLEDPFLLADMEQAAARIRAAVEDGERICVFGDYDCDGITATALLTSYLQAEGADVIYYVPSREEGYGLSAAALDMLSGQGVGLIVTVDNGVSAHEEIAHAATLGMDVVVTDHHTPRDTLPEAVAVVNPRREDCPSRCKELAGVGVAFKLVCALEGDGGEEMLEYYSDLVTLGTIADVVPLVGENRTMVRHGLARLPDTDNAGILALLQASGLSGRALTSETVAFGVAPRINAAGRIGTADDVIELLLTDDHHQAAQAAEMLNQLNIRRKEIEREILAQIETLLAERPQLLHKRVLTVTGYGWHHGVTGIVSARLVEQYDKPCIVFSVDGGEARGSGRSVPGFSLIQAITACSQNLTRFGGHTLAAGLSLPEEFLSQFDDDLQRYAGEHYPVMPLPQLAADISLPPQDLTVENIQDLSRLEPFGAGNEAPLFHMGGLVIQGIYPTGDGRHIRVRLAGGGNSFYAVYFGVSEAVFPYKTGDSVEIMAKITTGEYNGKTQLSVKLADLRPGGVPQDQVLLGRERYACYLRGEAQPPQVAERMIPSREDIALVYKYLRRAGHYPYGADALYLRLMAAGVDYCKLLLALDVLEEMGFLQKTGDSPPAFQVVEGAPRADLADSRILIRLGGWRDAVPVS